MGEIDTDPASCALANETVGAKVFYALDADGLKQEWHGRVWLNPPYAQPAISKFGAKLIGESTAGMVTDAILLNSATDAAWFQKAASWASAICLPARRIKCISPHGLAPGPKQGIATAPNRPDAVKSPYQPSICPS